MYINMSMLLPDIIKSVICDSVVVVFVVVVVIIIVVPMADGGEITSSSLWHPSRFWWCS